MAIKFLDKIKNIPTAFQNAMLGTPVQVTQPQSNVQYQYPTQRQTDFMNNFMNNQDLINKIQATPHYQGYNDQELFNRVAQGQNFGLKELADEQKQWNIKLPRANNDYDRAALEGNYLNVYQPMLQTGTANVPRQGGILRDMAAGARENYNEGFSPDNFGQQKNWATRIGEGLGTLARFGDSSLGRGLIAGGLIGALGGTPAEMTAYGLSAGVGRQNALTKNRVYGKSLKDMGYTNEDIGYGNITDDMYKNMSLNSYRQNMNNYRNLKLDKDTYVKEYKNISDLLDRGLITAEQATQQIMFLNQEYNRQNNIALQEGNRTRQGDRRLDIMENLGDRRLDITESQGNRRLDIMQQNADTNKEKARNDGKYTRPTRQGATEGTIIVNKKTGKRMKLIGGKWQVI